MSKWTIPAHKQKKLRRGAQWQAYQIAGELLLSPDHLTEGQKDRLTELLLNILSSSADYSGRTVRILRDSAVRE